MKGEGKGVADAAGCAAMGGGVLVGMEEEKRGKGGGRRTRLSGQSVWTL